MEDKVIEAQEASTAIEQSGTDYLGMSDEEILNMGFPEDEPEADEGAQAPEEEPEGEDEVEDEEDENLFMEDEDEESEEDEGEVEEEESTENLEEDETSEEVQDEGTEDYKSKYEELLAPFKANGKDIKVDTAEDLRRLAQMGVGYNAKMAALKPVRKIAKMLENEGLLDESKINYLIDLSKNNPDAINKLVKDSGINPLDLDTESTEGYKPNTYTVEDNQLELDEALIDLEQSPTGQRAIDVVSNKWDKASQRVLVTNPAYMRDLEAHIQNGVYDKVMEVVERDRLLGRIPQGVSDLEAYNFIGNQLHAQGAFADTPASTPKATEQKPKAKPANSKRKSRKRAAASTRSKPATTKQMPDSFLDMDDAEFEKQLMSKYI